jgi:hypothetical protein
VGPAGPNGFNTLVVTASEGAGANCSMGGTRIQVGLDTDRDGTLDAGEIIPALTRYVCNGQTGPQGPAGANGAFGDGSAGDLIVSIGQTLDLTSSLAGLPAGANVQFRDINVAGTLIVPSGTALRASRDITVSGTVTVAVGAADSGGGDANLGVSRGSAGLFTGGLGLSPLQAAQVLKPGVTGGGAGSRAATTTGGEGGGSLVLAAGGQVLISASGQVLANGASSVNPQTPTQGIVGGGGGGGGVVIVAAKGTLTVAGAIRANGGNGSNGWDGNLGAVEGGGGGGGGGIIHLISSTAPSVTGSLQVNGGAAGANAAPTGTVTAGHGGGACRGNGGNGGGPGPTLPENGAAGQTFQTVAPAPETLIF